MSFNMLTNDELDILIEALDDWTKSGEAGFIMSSLLEASFAEKTGRDPKKIIQQDREKLSAQVKNRERKATLLKAKLIQMQEAMMDRRPDAVNG